MSSFLKNLSPDGPASTFLFSIPPKKLVGFFAVDLFLAVEVEALLAEVDFSELVLFNFGIVKFLMFSFLPSSSLSIRPKGFAIISTTVLQHYKITKGGGVRSDTFA